MVLWRFEMIRTEIKGFKLNIGEHEGLPCTLPMSVFGTLHSAGITPDPYFAENFRGPQKAVDKFIEESDGKYQMYPIGDGISMMIVGF